MTLGNIAGGVFLTALALYGTYGIPAAAEAPRRLGPVERAGPPYIIGSAAPGGR